MLYIGGLKQSSKREGEGCLTENFFKTVFRERKTKEEKKKKRKRESGSNENYRSINLPTAANLVISPETS